MVKGEVQREDQQGCRQGAVHTSTNHSINQEHKTSYANGQTNPGRKHKAPDHNHEATQPMVDLPTHKLRLDATACTQGAVHPCKDKTTLGISSLLLISYINCSRGNGVVQTCKDRPSTEPPNCDAALQINGRSYTTPPSLLAT